MNYNYHQYRPGFNQQFIRPQTHFTGAVKNLIIANVAVFLFMTIFRTEGFFLYYFGLVPRLVWSKGFIWQLVTYMFIHGGFGHIFMNMFVLWMFGTEIEHAFGKREFYKFYFITGIGSGIITMLFSLNSPVPVVGASGAIYGVLVAFAMLYPNRLIYFYFLIPVRAKYFVLIIGIITFFSSFSQGAGGISHLTHLGGILIAYLYLKKDFRNIRLRIRLPKIIFRNPFKNIFGKTKRPSKPGGPDLSGSEQTMRDELDRLLDKINRSGYESLSAEERKNLDLIGKYFADKEKLKN